MRPEIRAIIYSFFDYETYACDLLKLANNRITVSSSMKYLEIPYYYSKQVESWTIPAEIKYLTNLIELNLSSSNLSGPLHPSLFQLTSLKVLQLNSNRLKGLIPKEIAKLTHLTFLDLSNNFLSGVLPSEIWSLDDAVMLYLNSNNFQGFIPDVPIGKMQSLMRLNLNNNQLLGFFGKGISQMPKLQLLGLDNNVINHVPVLTSTSLYWIHLNGNPLNGISLFSLLLA